jgi:hypothetical protein
VILLASRFVPSHPLRALGALGLLLALAALLIPGPAAAEEVRIPLGPFGGVGGPSFVKATALAVDQESGDVYVADGEGSNGSISRYHADGTPSDFSSLGGNVIDGKGPGSDETPQNGLLLGSPELVQVAVDNSGGPANIYVAELGANLVDIFAPSGEHLGQITQYKEGPAAEGAVQSLESTCGVGVDEAGNIYVPDPNIAQIHKYDPSGNNVANFGSVSFPCTLAPGAGPTTGFLFANNIFGELFKLDTTSGALNYKVDGGNTTVTVDPTSGHVLTATGKDVKEYDASGATEAKLLRTITTPSKVTGIAVDGSTGNLYVAREGVAQLEVFGPVVVIPDVTTEAATEITPTSATLNGTIDADGVPGATCHFQYTTEAAYQADKLVTGHDGFAGSQSAPCEPAGPFSGSSTNAVSAAANSLSPETAYRFRIVGENADGENEGNVLSFGTGGKPLLKGGSASEITTTAALISGEVDPRGAATTFAVEYVTEAQFEASEYAEATTVPVPGKSAGSGFGFTPISQQLTGLTPATAYHFRLAAENELGSAPTGEDHTFATFAVPSGLPDDRAYELVSPAFKLGEVYPPEPVATGLSGTCVSCLPGFEPQKRKMPMQPTPDGSAMTYMGGPFAPGLASGSNEYLAERGATGWETSFLTDSRYEEGTYKGFSADLSRGVLRQVEPVLSPEAPSSAGNGFANLYLWEDGQALEPLITVEPPNRDPGRPPEGLEPGNNRFDVTYVGANAGTGASPAFGHVVFEANDALTSEEPGIAPEAPAVAENESNLYEWSGGELRLVNVLPGNGAAAVDAVIGAGMLFSTETENLVVDHAISDDGSRIFWSRKSDGRLFVREGGTTTIEVQDPGTFLQASADGSKVLLNDGCLYDLEAEACEDLTLDQSAVHQGGFEGLVGAGEDLSRVYFVGSKALAGEEENANGEEAEDGEFNLYLSEGGTTTFIGQLVGSDNTVLTRVGTWHAAPLNRLAQASADGRYLAFMSRAKLTDYDNTRVGGGGCLGTGVGLPQCSEVFEYDAVKGELACPSCNPSGQRPIGQGALSVIYAFKESFPQPENLPAQGEGRLFFESQDTLSPADANGRIQDVYQWEPQGVGDCKQAGGCVTLISSGQSPKDSQFVAATPSGDDVFFSTRSQLVGRDIDDFLDLYDARVGGGIDEAEISPCLGEACRGAASVPPADSTPGSAGFVGPPNQKPKPCRKGFVKKHGKCVRKHRKHRKQKQHKRSAENGRGGGR